MPPGSVLSCIRSELSLHAEGGAGDEEARIRGTQKSVLERKAPPTFPLVIEMRERAHWVTHWTEDSVDCLLHNKVPVVQVMNRGSHTCYLPVLFLQARLTKLSASTAPVLQKNVLYVRGWNLPQYVGSRAFVCCPPSSTLRSPRSLCRCLALFPATQDLSSTAPIMAEVGAYGRNCHGVAP